MIDSKLKNNKLNKLLLIIALFSCRLNAQQQNIKYETIVLEPIVERLIVEGCQDTNERVSAKITAVNYFDNTTHIENIVLEATDGSRNTYYLAEDFEELLSNSELSWIPIVFKYGNNVIIELYRCGNAGYPYIKKLSFKKSL